MKVYAVPEHNTALSVIVVDGELHVIANTLDMVQFMLDVCPPAFEESVKETYKERPEFFWGLDDTIENDGDTLEAFVGETPRSFIDKAEVIYETL